MSDAELLAAKRLFGCRWPVIRDVLLRPRRGGRLLGLTRREREWVLGIDRLRKLRPTLPDGNDQRVE